MTSIVTIQGNGKIDKNTTRIVSIINYVKTWNKTRMEPVSIINDTKTYKLECFSKN